MKVISGLPKVCKYKNSVVAMGVFDGMHLGHRRILKETVRRARRIKGTAIAVTFYPHPQKKESLYSLEHRLRLIAQLGIDVCIVIRFNFKFSRISAENFIQDFLVKILHVHDVYVGKNFRFGRGAAGDQRLLDKTSHRYGFGLRAFEVVRINHQIISSTRIRKLIVGGRIAQAQRLLAGPVSVFGTVIKGSALARKLGFPTANINPHHEVLPPSGIYMVKVIYEKKQFTGVCYIGARPTFTKSKAPREKNVEVHIFNFHQDIYGENLEVQFIRRLRKEKKFSSLASLAEQIKKDINRAKNAFSPHKAYHNI